MNKLVAIFVLSLIGGGLSIFMASKHQQGVATSKTLDLIISLRELGVNKYILDVKLKNTGRAPLVVYRGSLPWASRHSLLLIAVRANVTHDALEERLVIDDPGPEQLEIKPGETLTGEILLDERFPDLPSAVRKNDVIIFWSYQLKPLNTAPLERMGGWLLIPKSPQK